MRFLAILTSVFLLTVGCGDSTHIGSTTATRRLNLNSATQKQLEGLPAVGLEHARSIIASRNARGGRFERIEDLLAIDGIGPKTVEAIRPYVVVE